MKKTLGILFLLLWTTLLSAQEMKVTGTVTSKSDGAPIPGVNIVEKGTTNGTITNFDGIFNLTVEKGKTIQFSLVGFKTVDIVATSNQINLEMVEDMTDLDEVVVVGYGVQKKSVVTGAIARVTADDFKNQVTPRVESALQGRTAGVIITTNSGQPGAGSTIRIRGIGTINNSNPLWIVDGVPIGGGIDFLSPSDIESIEVLKDAASSAIYGARAANGVILVTTKSGKAGRTVVSYDGAMGWQNPWKKMALLNATEYATLMNEASLNDLGSVLYANPASFGKGTDWQDQVFNYDAPMQNHNFTVSGGNEKATNLLSFSRFEQMGIVGGDKSQYERTSIKFNTDLKVWDEKRMILPALKVGANVAYSNVQSQGIEENSEWGSILGSAIMMMPTEGVYQDDPNEIARYKIDHPNYVVDKNGRVYNIAGSQEIVNPLADLQVRNSRGWSDKFVAKFYADANLFANIKFRSSYGADLAFWGDRGFAPVYYLGTTKKKDVNEVWKNTSRGLTWIFENTLMYDKSIGNHNIALLAGQSAQHNYIEGLYGYNIGLPEAIWEKAYISSATGVNLDQKASGGASEHTLASYFGRLNYNFNEKYLFQFVLRRDGSSNFGPNNKWATFPSVSAGWVITQEPFMEGVTGTLSFLKIRTGWGQNGNEAIGAFNYTSTLNGGNNYTFGGGANENTVNGVKPSKLTNPDVKWETSEQFNIGFDSRWLGGLVSLNADYFQKRTKDMLYTMQVPAHVGDAAPDGNIGSMENKGFEAELVYRPQIGKLKLDLSGNFTFLKNKVIEIGNEAGNFYITQVGTGDFVTRAQNGMPYGYFYGWVTDGIFQNQAEVDAYLQKVTPEGQSGNPQPGDLRFKDINNDGFLNDDDRKMIGNPFPEFMYGFTVSAEYKGFDCRMFVQGVYGNEVYDATRRTDLARMNYSESILGRWTGEGTSNNIPRMSFSDPNRNIRVSDRYVYDGSYLRVKDVQLGYTLPKNITQKVAIERLRFYVSGTNLLTFTNYPGFDPEIGAGFQGVDKGIYPQARTLSVGANVNF